jgi:uncharacterized membrane protein
MGDVNRALYWVLVVGMVISISLFVLGLAVFAVPQLQMYSQPVLTAAAVVLIATPVTRTLVGTIAFAMNRDMRAALVAGSVFLVLMFSLFVGYVLQMQI